MSAQLVIVGGGPVGLALALAASSLPNIDITVIERASAASDILPEPFDHRVYALSTASLGMLEANGAVLPPERMSTVRAMQVHGDGGRNAAGSIDVRDGHALAAIVEHAALMQALQGRLLQDGRVRILRGVSPAEMRSIGGNRRVLNLSDGSTIESDLLVAADGSRSQIRDWAGISTTSKDYESDGVVANFRAERAHSDIARQWFSQDAVLAYLPLPDDHISIVWSVSREASRALPSNDPQIFCRAVEEAGHHALGVLSLASPVARFPLVRVMSKIWVQAGLALIGDAAHAVHPLAGQGVNLGFADVRNMVAVLRDRSKYSAIGDLPLLRRYERRGREAAWAVGEMTDRLRTLYLSDSGAARWLRNEGVDWLNRVPVAKSLLIHYASR